MPRAESFPEWASEKSPWGMVWRDVLERPDWYRIFPAEPPFREGSLLRLRILRGRPEDVPAALRASDAPRDILSSRLGCLIDEGCEKARRRLEAVTPADVLKTLSAVDGGGEADIEALVSPAADAFVEEMMEIAAARTRERFLGRMKIYAPLYLSNECTNLCIYCGFNLKNPIRRIRLTPQEIEAEAAVLAERGVRHVLLLTGEAPARVGVGYLEDAVSITARLFDTVALEVFPMSALEYGRLVAAGASGLTLYQETYDVRRYHEVHRGGRKRNFLWRLGGPERAGTAGMSVLGIGSLLGLGDWRYEAVALGHHARWLRTRFPESTVTVSFPRLRAAPGGYLPRVPLSDTDLRHMMAALRLFVPAAGLVLSTREGPALRDRLAGEVVTQMSAGSRTDPGGYALGTGPASHAHQFEIEDRRSLAEVAERLSENGISAY